MRAWQTLFGNPSSCDDEAEAMKSTDWWKITKLKYTVIDTDVCLGAMNNEARDEEKTETPKTSGWTITKEKMPEDCKDHNCFLSSLNMIPRANMGNFVVRLELEQPREELIKKAEEDLLETEQVIKERIPQLQELLKSVKGLKVPLDNEAWLKRFLRPTKYFVESAFEKIKNYYQFKIKNDYHLKLYKDLKPSTSKTIFNSDIMTVLPKRDQHGRRILVVEIGRKWEYTKCSFDDIYKGAVIFLEAAMLEPETQICGAVLIFDMDGLSNSQIYQFSINLPFVARIVELLQKAAPIRIKGMHIVNQPLFFGCLLRLFTALMDAKFSKRIYQHGDMKNAKNQGRLHKHIAADRLPPQYGGTSEIPRLTGPEWYVALSMLDEEYEAVNSFGYNKDI